MAEQAVPLIIETRLRAIEKSQSAMNGVMGLILDTLQAQTSLLRELTAYARDEPDTSPMVNTLMRLTDAVLQTGESIDTMSAKFDELPATIAAIIGGELFEKAGETPHAKGA